MHVFIFQCICFLYQTWSDAWFEFDCNSRNVLNIAWIKAVLRVHVSENYIKVTFDFIKMCKNLFLKEAEDK